MSRWGRAIKFMETFCIVPKGTGHGKPIHLATFQKEHLEEILADGVGSAITSFPRGNGKSTLAAGLACWGLFDDDETGQPQVPVVATTVSQAVRSLFGVANRMVMKSPELASRSIMFSGTGTTRITYPYNGGEMFPIANTTDGLQGLDPSLGLFDEIGFQPLESWQSLVMASGKRERSLVWGFGTPGFDRENAFWLIKKAFDEHGASDGFIYRVFAADENCASNDRAQWHKANPALDAGFLREKALEDDLIQMPESAFRTFRLGLWTDGIDSWLGKDGRAVWKACEDTYELVEGAPSWVGLDIGIYHDNSAAIIVQRRPDGRLHARLRCWTPTKDEPVDKLEVMQHLRDLCTTYKVGAIVFDPSHFETEAGWLHDQGLPMVALPQTPSRMAPIIGSLFAQIKEATISHDVDLAFETQVLNGRTKPTMDGGGFTLSKGKSRGRIDAAIALALATYGAAHAKPPRAPMFVIT